MDRTSSFLRLWNIRTLLSSLTKFCRNLIWFFHQLSKNCLRPALTPASCYWPFKKEAVKEDWAAWRSAHPTLVEIDKSHWKNYPKLLTMVCFTTPMWVNYGPNWSKFQRALFEKIMILSFGKIEFFSSKRKILENYYFQGAIRRRKWRWAILILCTRCLKCPEMPDFDGFWKFIF